MPSKYLIIARELEQQLRRLEQTRLPTEAALCEQYGCSRQTVRSALAVLAEKGLIVRRQGSGSYPTQSAARSSRVIAVLIPDREEYLWPAFLRELRKTLNDATFRITCLETRGSRETERAHLEALLHQHPGGILLEPITDLLGGFNDDLLARLRAEGVPLVYLNGRYGVPAPVVSTDDAMGTDLLLAHLTAAGHRSISAILKSDDSRGPERYRGLLRAAAQTGIRFEHCLWYDEQERALLLDGDDTLLHRFTQHYRGDSTAVVCFNDEIACRLHVPQLTVVSFDNSYLARSSAITSLGCTALPTEAANTILHQIEGRQPEDVKLPWKLYVRK